MSTHIETKNWSIENEPEWLTRRKAKYGLTEEEMAKRLVEKGYQSVDEDSIWIIEGALDNGYEHLWVDSVSYFIHPDNYPVFVAVEIENCTGSTMGGFLLDITKVLETRDSDDVDVVQTIDVSHADTDGDYLFDTGAPLLRIQFDEQYKVDEDFDLDEYINNRG